MKLSGAVLASVAVGACGHASVQRTPIQQIGVDAIRDAGAVGVLAEIQHGDKHRRALRAGVADLRNPRPVPLNSYYRIGSTTKTFTATLVMQLIAEGKLKLTTPSSNGCPGWSTATATTVAESPSRTCCGTPAA